MCEYYGNLERIDFRLGACTMEEHKRDIESLIAFIDYARTNGYTNAGTAGN